MSNDSIILDPVKSIIDLTKKMDEKEKFAFINLPPAAIASLNFSSEKKLPKYFVKAISNCAAIEDDNFLKAVPAEIAYDIEKGKLANIGLNNNRYYYSLNTFEHFYNTRKEVVDIFVNHYIRDSKNVIVTFHDKKVIQGIFGTNQQIIAVPYNGYFDKIDSIHAQIAELDGKVDYCIMDCPLLATALAPKIWETLNMSILDLGRVVSTSRFSNTKTNEKR
jgi:hypothetical protein